LKQNSFWGVIVEKEIIIRHSESEDIPGIKSIFEGRAAYSNTLQLPYSSIKTWKARFETPQDGYFSLVAELDNEIVGCVGLQIDQSPARKHVGSCGIAVKDLHHQRGIGSKMLAAVIDLADNWLNLKRLEISTYTDNEKALSLYKKFGFQIEGESPYYAFRNGKFVSAYHMARINI
jgi:putative acetyltransferase